MSIAKIIQRHQELYWSYYRGEPNSGAEGYINYSIKDSESFDYKTSIIEKIENNSKQKNVEIVVSLKSLRTFWGTLEIPLINCEVSLTLTWYKICVRTSKATRQADPDANPAVVVINNPTDSTFEIKDTKLYVPVVTLSTQRDNKLLEQLKTGSKRTITRNKYRSEIPNQDKTDNFNYFD